MTDPTHSDVTHVTLVHGTFAPGAAWTKPGSALRNKVAEEFGGSVEFHSDFQWMGLPSHVNRHFAGQRLRSYLLELTAQHPGKHFIIGHSHGALVSLYALRDQILAKRIAGVISLSTPYLIARPRELSVLGKIAAFLGFFSMFFVVAALSDIPFIFYLMSDTPMWMGGPVFIISAIIEISSIAILIGIVFGIDGLTDWFLETMTIPRLHSDRLLIVRGPSDEATTLINLFHGLELIVTLIWGRRGPFDRAIESTTKRLLAASQSIFSAMHQPSYRLRQVSRWIGIILLVAGFAAFVLFEIKIIDRYEDRDNDNRIYSRLIRYIVELQQIILAFDSDILSGWLSTIITILAFPSWIFFWAVGGVLLATIVAGLFLGFLFVALVTCTAVLAITSVPELGPCAGTVVVSVEALPRGGYRVEQGDDTADMESFLTHSWSYTHPQALAAIAAWLKSPKPAGSLTTNLPTEI